MICSFFAGTDMDYKVVDFYEETKVKFAELSEEMLWEYINSGEPMWVYEDRFWHAMFQRCKSKSPAMCLFHPWTQPTDFTN